MIVAAFETKQLGAAVDAVAPDGSEIRVLLATLRGSMAHGTLPPGGVSLAVKHRTVDEIWYVLAGSAEMWRKQGEWETVELVAAGTSLTIPLGTSFQFRTVGDQPFRFIMCTMPPWPGEGEAALVEGRWRQAESCK